MVRVAGQAAVLRSPPSTAKFDPSASGDYAPDGSAVVNVMGFPHAPEEQVEGATGAFTIQATKKPAGLKANASTLDWAGETWKVVKYQPRTWVHGLNGYTLYLAI